MAHRPSLSTSKELIVSTKSLAKADPSQVITPPFKASKKITLVKALVIATLAIAAIALLYLEVKYRLVSIGISYAVTNPWIIGLISVVAIVGIAYLIYRNMKSPSTSATSTSSEGSTNPSSAVFDVATEEDLNAALAADSTLNVFFRGQYSFIEHESGAHCVHAEITRVLTFEEANRRVEYRFLFIQRFATGLLQPELFTRILEKLVSTRSLALRWLMSPHCIERV